MGESLKSVDGDPSTTSRGKFGVGFGTVGGDLKLNLSVRSLEVACSDSSHVTDSLVVIWPRAYSRFRWEVVA